MREGEATVEVPRAYSQECRLILEENFPYFSSVASLFFPSSISFVSFFATSPFSTTFSSFFFFSSSSPSPSSSCSSNTFVFSSKTLVFTTRTTDVDEKGSTHG